MSERNEQLEQLLRLRDLVQREQMRRLGIVGDPHEDLAAMYDRMEANLRASGWEHDTSPEAQRAANRAFEAGVLRDFGRVIHVDDD